MRVAYALFNSKEMFMKLKLAALGLSVALLLQANVSAKNALNSYKPRLSSIISKGGSDFYSASEIEQNVITLSGPASSSTPPTFTPLTFEVHVHKKGDAIKPERKGFKLEKGTYEITFTGTFRANPIGSMPSVFAADLILALKLDSVTFKNTQSIPIPPAGSKFFATVTYTKVIDVDSKKEISFVAANDTTGASISSLNRTITIKQLN
jgi:hypothetical protein